MPRSTGASGSSIDDFAEAGHVASGDPPLRTDGQDARETAEASLVLDEVLPPDRVPRVSVETRTPRAAPALAEVARAFGVDWREHVLSSHRISYAAPVTFCRLCGHVAGERRCMHGLGGPSAPVHDRARVLRWLTVEGRHPHRPGQCQVAPPHPIPPGNKPPPGLLGRLVPGT